MKTTPRKTSIATDKPISYAGYRFPPEVISYAIWLYFRFLLSLRMVEEMLAARGIEVTYETVRRWALSSGRVSPVASAQWGWLAATSGTSTKSW
jgi:putative transposase